MFRRLSALLLVLMLIASSAAFSQTAAQEPPARPTPTITDYVYGPDSPQQVFDFWKAKSDKATPVVILIHGGGWQSEDKSDYVEKDIRPFLDAGISVAATNYRYIK